MSFVGAKAVAVNIVRDTQYRASAMNLSNVCAPVVITTSPRLTTSAFACVQVMFRVSGRPCASAFSGTANTPKTKPIPANKHTLRRLVRYLLIFVLQFIFIWSENVTVVRLIKGNKGRRRRQRCHAVR